MQGGTAGVILVRPVFHSGKSACRRWKWRQSGKNIFSGKNSSSVIQKQQRQTGFANKRTATRPTNTTSTFERNQDDKNSVGQEIISVGSHSIQEIPLVTGKIKQAPRSKTATLISNGWYSIPADLLAGRRNQKSNLKISSTKQQQRFQIQSTSTK